MGRVAAVGGDETCVSWIFGERATAVGSRGKREARLRETGVAATAAATAAGEEEKNRSEDEAGALCLFWRRRRERGR